MSGVRQEDGVDPWDRPERRGRRQMPLWQELPLLLVVAFGLAVLIRTFLLQAFYIPSRSMEDTLLVGDRVLVNKVVYDIREPKRGEVVVFHGTDAWLPQAADAPDPGFLPKLGRTVGDLVGVSQPGEKDFIKRVIGLPGDRVKCCDDQGRVTVNGVALDETYVVRDSPPELPPNPRECGSRQFTEVVVPPGQIFVMGDYREVSQDSRCQGPVPIDNVIGRAFVVVWPRASWASLSVPATFGKVPDLVAAPAVTGAGAGSGTVVGGGGAPGPLPPSGGIAVVAPILAALGFIARSRRSISTRHRRLQP